MRIFIALNKIDDTWISVGDSTKVICKCKRFNDRHIPRLTGLFFRPNGVNPSTIQALSAAVWLLKLDDHCSFQLPIGHESENPVARPGLLPAPADRSARRHVTSRTGTTKSLIR